MASERISCPGCGADNRSDRRFCRSCGVALAATCPACGTPADPGDRFCGSCGATIVPGPTTSTTAGTAAGVASAGGGAELAAPDPSQLERRRVSGPCGGVRGLGGARGG